MKTKVFRRLVPLLFAILLFGSNSILKAENNRPSSQTFVGDNYTGYQGKIVEQRNNKPLAYAHLLVAGTNIATVTNSEGEFFLKIPNTISNAKIKVSYIGFRNRTFTPEELVKGNYRIGLEPISVELPELSVISKDAFSLVQAMFQRRGANYFSEVTPMTAFYRETIKKNAGYVSLSEAVVQINKQPYTSLKTDEARLFKSRKKADYSRLDTVTFKLQGGPVTSLYLDIMKYPDIIFTTDMADKYDFTFDRSTHMDDRLIYVVDFKQKEGISEPLYYGKLYIDANSLALKSAVFKLNISNREEAASLFIIKKPFNAKVFPTEATYRIDYGEKNGLWYYNYSRIEFNLRIIWKKKLFNTNYNSVIEMAVTDWGNDSEKIPISPKERLRSSVIISDEASGFSDPQFWGEYNVIEPEKPIQSAIRKIQKQLEKAK